MRTLTVAVEVDEDADTNCIETGEDEEIRSMLRNRRPKILILFQIYRMLVKYYSRLQMLLLTENTTSAAKLHPDANADGTSTRAHFYVGLSINNHKLIENQENLTSELMPLNSIENTTFPCCPTIPTASFATHLELNQLSGSITLSIRQKMVSAA